MLFKDIDYYYHSLLEPINILGISIKEIYIDPYFEKHNQEYLDSLTKQGITLNSVDLTERIITNDWIVEFVQQLATKELGIGKRYDNWVYYVLSHCEERAAVIV